MQKLILVLSLLLVSITNYAEVNSIASKGSYHVVISRHGGILINHNFVSIPEVIFNSNTNQISIDFGNQPIEDYTVTISSPFTDVDYYVTSSYTTIPLVVDGISDYTIIIETSDGDVFEGTLAASEYSTTVMY